MHEIKLGDEYLMSSLFTVSEVELARLALARLEDRDLHVVVGGLGLGYTACAVLEDDRVSQVLVIEALEPVISWHQQGLVPLGPVLTGDAGSCTENSSPWQLEPASVPLMTLAESPQGCSSECSHPGGGVSVVVGGCRWS